MMNDNVCDRAAGFWDAQAVSFDDEPDHGLTDRTVREAWMARLRSWLPAPPAEVADLGCGTGTLPVLLAGESYGLRGVDLSVQMLRAARAKAAAAGWDAGADRGSLGPARRHHRRGRPWTGSRAPVAGRRRRRHPHRRPGTAGRDVRRPRPQRRPAVVGPTGSRRTVRAHRLHLQSCRSDDWRSTTRPAPDRAGTHPLPRAIRVHGRIAVLPARGRSCRHEGVRLVRAGPER